MEVDFVFVVVREVEEVDFEFVFKREEEGFEFPLDFEFVFEFEFWDKEEEEGRVKQFPLPKKPLILSFLISIFNLLPYPPILVLLSLQSTCLSKCASRKIG